MSQSKIAKVVAKKIGYQFPDTPEGKLMFAILDLAIRDFAMTVRRNRVDHDEAIKISAYRYLKGDMEHCQRVGIDPAWVRRVINESGLVFYFRGEKYPPL